MVLARGAYTMLSWTIVHLQVCAHVFRQLRIFPVGKVSIETFFLQPSINSNAPEDREKSTFSNGGMGQ